MMQPETGKILQLSTVHLSESDFKMLSELDGGEDQRHPPFCNAYPTKYGAFITIGPYDLSSPEWTEWGKTGYSAELFTILHYAFTHNIQCVHFDADADLVDLFPTFDWQFNDKVPKASYHLSVTNYMAKGRSVCPYCGAVNITQHHDRCGFGNDDIDRPVTCNRCKREWTEELKLINLRGEGFPRDSIILSMALEISTAHITANDDILLQQKDEIPFAPYYDYDGGYFIILAPIENRKPDYEQQWKDTKFSPAFSKVIDHARKIGVRILRLDADGDKIPELPTFEW